MLDTRNLSTGRPSEKLAPRWEGPFEVVKSSSHAVKLDLPANMKVNNVFHVQLVRRWEAEGIPGQEASEPNVNANRGRVMVRTDGFQEEQQYEFDNVLDYGKAENGRSQYLVKWTGYEEPSWQPVSDLKGCPDVLWAFHEAHPDKGKPPPWLKRPVAAAQKHAAPRRSPRSRMPRAKPAEIYADHVEQDGRG